MPTFQGAWPAMVTLYTADNQVDVGAINALVDYLLDKRVGGFYLCGSTGQGIYQSVAERKLVTQTALRRIDGRVPAIVHAGSQALGDAIELAVHAQEAGASGVSSIIPAGYADLTYATPHGHAFLYRRLYLPEGWCPDPERCAEAKIPADVGFATKPEQAVPMV